MNFRKLNEKEKVGKKIGYCFYVHKNYAHKVIPTQILGDARKYLPDDFEYTIVKYHKKTNTITFLYCPDWDTVHEPEIYDTFIVKREGWCRRGTCDGKSLYHHRWMFVGEDYEGFDREESIKRSEKIREIIKKEGPHYSSKIGRRAFWKKFLKKHKMEK